MSVISMQQAMDKLFYDNEKLKEQLNVRYNKDTNRLEVKVDGIWKDTIVTVLAEKHYYTLSLSSDGVLYCLDEKTSESTQCHNKTYKDIFTDLYPTVQGGIIHRITWLKSVYDENNNVLNTIERSVPEFGTIRFYVLE